MVGSIRQAKRPIAFLVLVLILALPVSAYTVEKAWVEWNGNEVKTISSTTKLPDATLNLRLSPDFKDCFDKYRPGECKLIVAYPFTAAGTGRTEIDVRNCERKESTITCRTPKFTFNTTTPANTVTYLVSVPGTRAEAKAVITLVIDDTRPKVATIKTGYCEREICYAAANVPTPITITFEDTVTAFDYRLVIPERQGGQSTFIPSDISCQGKACKANIILPCADGEELTLQLRDVSREDAMNQVILGQGQKVVCSTKAPKILEWTKQADGIAGQAVSGGAFTVKAKVQSLGMPVGTVNTTNVTPVNITKATCTSDSSDSTLYACTFTLSPLQYNVPTTGRAQLTFRVADALGAYVERTESITVLNLTRRAPNQNLEFFSVRPTKVVPERLNRMALDLARGNYMPYPAYVTYDMQRKKAGARILKQELKGCVYKFPNETNYTAQYNLFSFGGRPTESRILYPDQDYDKPNRLNLQIRADRTVLAQSDDFDVKCQLDLFVAEGQNIYEAPQSVNISFKVGLRESALGQPGETFVAKIKEVEEGQNSGMAKTIRNLEMARQRMDTLCQAAESLQMMQSVAATVQGVGHGFCSSGVLAGQGKAISQVAEAAYNPSSKIIGKLWDGTGEQAYGGATSVKSTFSSNSALKGNGGFLRKVCRQVNCRVAADLDASRPNYFSSDLSLQQYFKDATFNDLNAADPQASLSGSVMTMCFGGVIYNLQKYNAVNCGYLQCLKDQSMRGSSIAVCEQAKGYQTCQYIAGEFMELPYARVVKNIMSNVNGIVSTAPAFVARYYSSKACTRYTNKLQQNADKMADQAASGAVTTASKAACPDWWMVTCRVKDSVFGILDVRKQSNPAFQGIRDPIDNAKLCADATVNLGSNGKRSQVDYLRAAAKLGAFSRDVNAQRTSYYQETIQERVDKAYAQVYRVPGQSVTLPSSSVYTIAEGAAKGEVLVSFRGPDGKEHSVKMGGDVEAVRKAFSSDVLQAARDGYTFNDIKIFDKDGKVEKIITAREQAENYIKIKEKFADTTKIPADLNIQAAKVTGEYNKAKAEYDALVDKYQQVKRELEAAGGDPKKLSKEKQELLTEFEGKERTLSIADRERNKILAQQATLQRIELYANNPQAIKARQEEINYAAEDVAKFIKDKGDTLSEADRKALQQMQDDIMRDAEQLSREKQAAEQFKAKKEFATIKSSQQFANTIGMGTDYAAKWAFDRGYLDFLMTAPPGLNRINPDKVKQSLCSELNYDIKDNDDGIIFDGDGGSRVLATFGTEVLAIENETGKSYAYITIAHVRNPTRSDTQQSIVGRPGGRYDFTVSVKLRGLKGCTARNCPQEYSLTNGAVFNLTEGTTFGRGNMPVTRILYLPGEYEQVCITFNKPFPVQGDPASKAEYCRTIKEKVFETGINALPQPNEPASSGGTGGTGGPGAPAPATTDPLKGWS